jgi:hypothetical protein
MAASIASVPEFAKNDLTSPPMGTSDAISSSRRTFG